MFMWPEVEHSERDYFSEFLQNRFVRHSGEVVFEPADLSHPPVRLFLRFVLGGEEVLPVVFGRDVELLRKNLGNICHIAMRSIPFDGLRLAGETGDLRTQGNLWEHTIPSHTGVIEIIWQDIQDMHFMTKQILPMRQILGKISPVQCPGLIILLHL